MGLSEDNHQIGSYRLEKLLHQLDDMAEASPRSPAMSQALNSPLEFLPVTRFPTMDPRDSLQEAIKETKMERQVIQNQPYRTTQLVFPNPKTKPDLVNNRLSGKAKPSSFRPLDQRNVVANLNENQALVSRQQYNNPRPLYSDQNVQEAIYVQTGVNYQQQPQQQITPQQQQQFQQQIPQQQQQYQQQSIPQQQQPMLPKMPAMRPQPPMRPQQQPLQQQRQPTAVNHQLQAPIHMTPDHLPEFKPANSPTYRAILEEEGPGTLTAAPNTQKAPPQKIAHHTTPTYHLNSVGGPTDRIAQSGSFKRLMYSVMSEF